MPATPERGPGGGARGDGLTATGRVPAEHRLLGLDRRTLLPGLLVLGLFVLWTVVVPGVNGLLGYDSTTKAGDVFLLAPGTTMDAQPGWGIESGLLTTDRTAVGQGGDVLLVRGGSALQVSTGPFSGDARTLLDQIEKVGAVNGTGDAVTVSGDPVPFRTTSGTPGVAQAYRTADGEGLIAALVAGDRGVKVIATGPGATLGGEDDAIERMVESIRHDPGAQP